MCLTVYRNTLINTIGHACDAWLQERAHHEANWVRELWAPTVLKKCWWKRDKWKKI